jgi:hypothetical protein
VDEFLTWSRQAFRSLHGLPRDGEAIPLSEEAQERLLAWARRHRVTGLLQAGVPGTGAALQAAAYGQTQHTARSTHEAERLAARLSPALPTLTLVKGPALAAQAWPEPGLRSFDDLDFLCERCDFPRLLAGMQAAGYAPEIEEPRRRAHRWHYGWGISFLHPEGFMVEVNHRFFPPHYPWPCQLDGRRNDLYMDQKLDGASVRAPVPALHLLLCCLHAVWHGWARLAWLADIAGLLMRHPKIYSQAEVWVARCPFAQQTLIAGCGVAEALFGPGLTAAPLPRTPPATIGEAVALLQGTARSMRGRELRSFHEQFMTNAEKTTYRIRRACFPGDGDFKWIPLPVALRWLYWILRPIRGGIYGKSAY